MSSDSLGGGCSFSAAGFPHAGGCTRARTQGRGDGALNTLEQCWDNTSCPCGTLSGRRGDSGGNNLRGAELLLGRVLRDGVLRLLREEDYIVARLLGMGGGIWFSNEQDDNWRRPKSDTIFKSYGRD